ncbi:MAG: hypothetical protein AAFQ38_16390 [Pseudomonadota bacterium]
MARQLYRIGVIGTKGQNRQYISETDGDVAITGRANALHWNKKEAMILASAFNSEFAGIGRTERFQIERAV